eukprot:jgi/Undpi1/1028/HiC_scaffold_10.g04492.m1
MIGATGHEQLKASDEPLVLGPEEDWLPKEELELEMLLKGRHPEAHDKTIKDWMDVIHTIVAGSHVYLDAVGEDRSCLEAKLREVVPTAPVQVRSKNLFVQPGSTKNQEDNEAALARIQVICNADIEWVTDPDTGDLISEIIRRVLVEGDQETFGWMVDTKRGNPEKSKWLLPHPGGWHILMHFVKALNSRYYGAGVERVAEALGGNDTLTRSEGVIPWLKDRASKHKTLSFWTQFLLEDYPAYLAYRVGGRSGNYELCVAALRVLAPIFTAAGKTNYQHLAMEHLTNLARMTDEDRKTIGTVFTSSYSGKDFSRVFLDEFQEMANKDVKGALGRITQAFMAKLATICESRGKAVREFDEHLSPDFKERDVVPGIIRDRAGGVAKVVPWLKQSPAFSPEGADRLMSLGGAVVTKADEDLMLDCGAISKTWWCETLTHHVSGKEEEEDAEEGAEGHDRSERAVVGGHKSRGG